MGTQDEVAAFLGDPATHGGAAVERIATHCSIVFLAGERAYKLKRAVVLPYLDYGTVERRRRMCEAEIALNRRTAPALYLRAAAIVRAPGVGLAIAPPGQGEAGALDWIVVMRRFPAEAAFDRMAERGALCSGHLVSLAESVAAFHARAEVHAEAGGEAGMLAVVESNRASFALAGAGVFDPGAVAALERETRAALDRLAPLLERRRAAGKVRQCHGDLHLRNVVMWDGRPTPFDGIEFDDALARIDVLYDLAFLLMDLERRGLRGHANATLNAYLGAADEWDGLALLPFFMSCRAAVRAHVAAATALSEPLRAAEQEAEARSYLAFARALLEPAPARLVAIGGLSGTGKSTLARSLAPALGPAPGAVVLRSDAIRKRLKGVVEVERLTPDAYLGPVTAKVYATIALRARSVLSAGLAVVADAVYADPAERAAIEDATRATGCAFDGLWLEAPAETLVRRVEARRADASDATAKVVRRQLGYDLGVLSWRRVDASGGPAATAAEAGRALGLPPA